MITTKVRNSNLELFRIFVMLSIVAHHYVVNSGLLDLMDVNTLCSKSIFLYLFGMWGKTGINCFVLITGYFMCKSEITLLKYLKLILEVLFYNIIFYVAFSLSGYIPFSIKDFLFYILPIKGIHQNFVSCYLIFYLFIPFLSVLVKHLNQKSHGILIILCMLVYTFMSLIPRFGVTMNYVSWFSVIFIIGSYIRLYPIKCDTNTKFWMLCMLGSIIIAILSVIGLLYLNLWGYNIGAYGLVSDSNAILAVVVSISAFMFFKNIKIKHSTIINLIGGSTFGVLLIHSNSAAMRKWLWRDFLNNVSWYETPNIYVHAIVSVIGIFIVCVVIDVLRIHLFEKPVFKYINNRLENIDFKSLF